MGSANLTQIYQDLKDRRRRGEPTGEPSEQEIDRLLQPWIPPSLTSPLSPHKSLVRELDVLALAFRVFGDELKAKAWLIRPNAALSGQTPADLLEDELGAAVVRETLEQIDHGIFA